MKFLSSAIVLALMASTAHGGQMVRQSTNPKCNAKDKIPAGSNQQWSSAASQTGQTGWTQAPSTDSSQSTQQWSSASSQQDSSDSSQSTQQQSSTASSGATTTSSACTLTGTYSKGADVSSCKNIVINDLSVPASTTLDLTKVAKGATITFEGTTTFEQAE